MAARYRLDQDERIVYSHVDGELTDADLLDHMASMRALFEDGAIDSTWAQIADFSAATTSAGISPSVIREMAHRNPWPEGAIRVLITPTDVLFGLVRMYQLFGGSTTEQIHITRSATEAEEWVTSERARRS